MKHKPVALALVLVLLALALGARGTVAQGLALQDKTAAPRLSAAFPANALWLYNQIDRAAIGSGNDRGQYVSVTLRATDGFPFISYYDATALVLRYAFPNLGGTGSCGPSGNWNCYIVDNTLGVGKYSSIGIPPQPSSTYVGISYYDETNGALKFAEYVCSPNCQWDIATISHPLFFSVGSYSSLKYGTDGVPHIAYYSSSGAFGYGLMYAHRVGSGGNCAPGNTWQCDSIDSGSGSGLGKFASLDLNGSNQPRIAYYDGFHQTLKYAQLGGSGANCGPGGNTWVCQGVEIVPDNGKFASLQVSKSGADNPQIAYYSSMFGKLRYAKWVGSGGNCASSIVGAWQCDAIDDMGVSLPQAGISLAVDATGNPFVAYMQAPSGPGANVLKIARPISALGLPNGNCGPGNAWQCDTLDIGSSNTDEADYAAIALNSSGLATIAYHESDSYYPTGYLKVAYQRVQLSLPLVLK